MLLFQYKNCIGYLLTWTGFLPAHITMTAYCLISSFLFMPCNLDMRKKAEKNLDFNKRLVWHDEDKEDKKRSLSGGSPMDYGHQSIYGSRRLSLVDIQEKSYKPCFCFELALKIYYWCLLAYKYDFRSNTKIKVNSSSSSSSNVDKAKTMFNIEWIEQYGLSERECRAVIAWGLDTILIVFVTHEDMGVQRKQYKSIKKAKFYNKNNRRHDYLSGNILVNKSVQDLWLEENLNEKILSKINEIKNKNYFRTKRARIIVTGHGLGATLANLAALDIKLECDLKSEKLMCYTFGSFKLGNSRFKMHYDREVSDTWDIINDGDDSLLLGLLNYKKLGDTVIISGNGDLIISPLFVETYLTNKHNFINRKIEYKDIELYKKCFSEIIRAQYNESKCLPSGFYAIDRIIRKRPHIIKETTNIELESLQSLS